MTINYKSDFAQEVHWIVRKGDTTTYRLTYPADYDMQGLTHSLVVIDNTNAPTEVAVSLSPTITVSGKIVTIVVSANNSALLSASGEITTVGRPRRYRYAIKQVRGSEVKTLVFGNMLVNG
jgi:hypothetical protein